MRAGVEHFDWVFLDSLRREHLRNSRRYAQVYIEEGIAHFEFAPQVLWLTRPHRLGLIAHEIGHVVDTDPERTEEGADACAMEALGVLILYDPRWPAKGLQTGIR